MCEDGGDCPTKLSTSPRTSSSVNQEKQLYIVVHLKFVFLWSIKIDCDISEPCYKGTIL